MYGLLKIEYFMEILNFEINYVWVDRKRQETCKYFIIVSPKEVLQIFKKNYDKNSIIIMILCLKLKLLPNPSIFPDVNSPI